MITRKISIKTLYHLTWILFFLISLTKLVHSETLEESHFIKSTEIQSSQELSEEIQDGKKEETSVMFDRTYYQEREEGWFWYRMIPVPKKEIKKEPKKETQETVKKIEPKDFQSKWPEFKHAEDIHVYLNELKDKAVMNPTVENIKDYLEFQKYVMSKSRLFADVTQRVIWSNPELDQSARKPLGEITQPITVNEKIEDTSKKLKEISEKGGIYFFFLSTCPYCHMEAPLLRQLEAMYGIKVIPVSIDGPGLPEYPHPIQDRGIAHILNVEKTPTLFFGKPPKEIRRIANGFISLPELIDRIISVSEGVEYND